jgi:peptidyl-dipeptidase Dcp
MNDQTPNALAGEALGSPNPLLEKFDTPHQTLPFDRVRNEHFLPAVKAAIAQGRQEVDAIAQNPEPPTFANTIVALDRAGERLNRVSAALFNLNAAETSPELQQIVREASPLTTEYSNDIALNQPLFARIRAVYEQRASLQLGTEDAMLLDKTYKSFARNGANLPETDQAKFRQINQRLSELTIGFNENVLEETNQYQLHLTDEQDLAGLPEFAREAAQLAAKAQDRPGWVFTLQAPSYIPFMTYSERRELRQQLFMAYNARGFHGDQRDNQAVVKEIVKLRHERAKLLGYASHADFVLEERMAGSAQRVEQFLDQIYHYAKPVAEQQMRELLAYAQGLGFADTALQRWDYSFYAEKLKKEKYAIDDETLKPYFKLENVVEGVFQIAHKLFGLTFRPNPAIPVYHPEVTAYEVFGADGQFLSVFYTDFFPRPGKRNGAWATAFRTQEMVGGANIRPHVANVCNFTRPTDTKPSLLTFVEVKTLFHEFGHALHAMLSQCQYGSLSGTSVYWDFVELPSQIMENWCTEKAALDLFARHYQTGEPLPQALVDRIVASANFMEGYATMRQLSFGMLDMAYHAADQEIGDLAQFEQQALAKTNLLPPVPGTNVSTAFGHIFAGGYSAGYYSYKWAEVLDADAFALFKQRGIFDPEVAQAFANHILSRGGSEHPMTLYQRFRGQEPSPKPLLERAGLLQPTA